MSALVELAMWYAEQCDGEWEHARGVSIRSCDNPGWWVQIDLVGTPISERPFNLVSEGVNEAGFPEGDRWLRCYVRDGIWQGAGDPSRLEEIVQLFLAWTRDENAP